MTQYFTGGDDDETTSIHENPEASGGPEAGNYTPPADTPIPGEAEALDNSQL